MPIPTTTAEQYTRLRSYLNPYIRGPNVDAVLNALAASEAAYLINNVAAVNDQMYIVSASGVYLDEKLAQYGITRPPAVGLSDDVFSQIGIQVKNRKQVRDLINNLLDVMFGDEFVKASLISSNVEPYALQDGDTLIVNFDANNTTTITFSASQFTNIGAALAQEVADAITSALSTAALTGTAISNNNGSGNYVELLSSTIGPKSSVTVMGGSAQNALQFPAIVPAGGNMSTQWTITQQSGGSLIRFTWTGGANPQLGKVSPGNYVNIFGGGFSSSTNEGSFTIVESVGGAVDDSYFEVSNPLGTSGVVTQGADDAVLFYNPIKNTILSMTSYAAVFQTSANILYIFLPASTTVIRRSRIGSAHIHFPPTGTFTLNSNPSFGDTFGITSTVNLVAGSSFVIGDTTAETALNIVNSINEISGLIANVNDEYSIDGLPQDLSNVIAIQNNSVSNTLTITYSGSQNIIASGPLGDPTSLQPNQYGPYGYDITQPFVIGSIQTTLEQTLNSASSKVIQVANSSEFPDQFGYFMLGYGTELQEGPIPYISVPSNDTLLISPSYTVQNSFGAGTNVALIPQNSAVIPATDGSDYQGYVTDVISGREYAQDLINQVVATGINIVFTIQYPSDIGLGKWGTPYSEISTIWGS